MAADDRAIAVDGVAFQISPQAVDALLRGEGVEIRLSGFTIHLSEPALNAILARLAPEGEAEALRATLSTKGVAIDRRAGGKTLRLDIAVSDFRLHVADGELRLESGSGS